MEKIPWYQSAIVRQQVVMAIVGLVGLFKVTTDVDWDATVTAVFAGVAALVPIWTIVTRLFKANPPLTDTAARHEEEVQAKLKGAQEPAQSPPAGKQGGFIRAGALVLILALSVALPAILTLQGCAAVGLPTAETFNERLAAGYTTVTAVREATGVWLDGKVRAARQEPDPERQGALIAAAKADAQNVQDQADRAREGLDVARSLRGLDLGAAEERLASTLRILEALQTYLEGRT